MTTPDRITVDVRAVWTIAPEKDRPYPRMNLAVNVAQFVTSLSGLVPSTSQFEQAPGQLVVDWRWPIPRHTFGMITPIYKAPLNGTRGLLAAILEHTPPWMPPARVDITTTAGDQTYHDRYDAEEDGDPWTYAREIMAVIN